MNLSKRNEVKFDERGLIPAIVQNAATREVLTLAYMNRREPCSNTIETRADMVLVAVQKRALAQRRDVG